MYKKHLILLGFILALGYSAFAAPAPSCTDNDDCASPATITFTTGVQNCITDCNISAASSPDFTGNNCYDFLNATVWYEVTTTASSATIDIALTSTDLTNPYFAIFTTSDCSNYTIINCSEGSSGSVTNTVSISTSTTYLIAISDQNGAEGNFDLCITVNDDNSACNTNNVLTVSATSLGSPLEGPYQAGEIVSFCYTITDYQQVNCNYLQGIVPEFGDCWDPVSFTAQGAPVTITTPLVTAANIALISGVNDACDGTPAGTWSWFPSGSVTYNNINNPNIPNGTALGAGWYFLTSYSSITGACNGDPTDPDDSYGDGSLNCDENTYDWTVCFDLQTRTDGVTTCSNGLTDCSVSIKTFADGEIGVYDNVGCTSDITSSSPSTTYSCCIPTPTIYNVGGGGAICLGGTGVPITLSDSEIGVSYQLYLDDVATGTSVDGTGSAVSFGNQTSGGSYTIKGTYTATTCNIFMNGSATITISGTIPTLTLSPTSSSICSGQSVALTATVTPVPATVPVTFTNSTSVAIPDNNAAGINSNITVTGVDPIALSSGMIVSLCFTITHQKHADIGNSQAVADAVYIQSPSGTQYNFTPLPITGANTTITYCFPIATLNSITGNANGTWTLHVEDNKNTKTGTLDSWSIELNSANTTTFTWSPTTDMTGSGTLVPTVSPSSTTAYTISATDQTGCATTITSNITVSPGITLSTTQTNVACFGNLTGAVDLTVSGGTSPFTYLWTGGSTSEDLSGVAAGTYSVTVTDALSCTNTTSVTLTQPASALTASITSQTNVKCFGNVTGAASLTRGGGTSPYTYLWTGGAITQNLTNVVAGIYSVTVTDDSLCTVTASVTITEPAAALSTSVLAIDADCFGATTGSANTTTTGGTSPYTYIWDDPLFQTTANATGLTAGTYNVTVTDSLLCTTTASVTITQPAEIILTSVVTNSTCGNPDGVIDLTVAGGMTPITFSWSNLATSEDINTLLAGAYTVTTTDANSCTETHTANVTDIGAPTATITDTTFVSCNGGNDGSATVTISGTLNPPYDYEWSTTTQSIDDPLETNTESGLLAGTISVTITDNIGCQANASVSISEPSALNLSIIAKTNVSCNTGNDGSATVSVSGGTAGYTYLWNDPAIQTTLSASALTAGTYTVTVTDSELCADSVKVTITEPALLTVTSSEVNVTCNSLCNASSTANPTGGTSPYTYNWDDGQNSQTAINLCDGTYNVTITDNKNCSETITVTITEPAILSASIVVTMPSCNGSSDGIANLSVVGGTSPYTFIWSTTATTEDINGLVAGIYNVTITDINSCQTSASVTISEPAILTSSISATNVSCNTFSDGIADLSVSGGSSPYSFVWSNLAITEDITGLVAASFYVTITDSEGCVKLDSIVITEPIILSASILGTNLSCNLSNNGVADLSVNGGTFPYTYLWSNAETIEDISNLTIGNYDVTVTDNNNCQTNASVTLSEPAILAASIIEVNVSCDSGNDGEANLTISGGTTPYSYLWDNMGASTIEDLSGLSAGTYNVTVTDLNYCEAFASVTITEPAPVNADAGLNETICIGDTISLTASGGNTYEWSNTETSAIINVSPVTDTIFYVTVTDATGCTGDDSVSVLVNLLPLVDAGIDVAFCEGDSAMLNATGGVNYIWSNSAGNTAIVVVQPLFPQYYYVTVTDINGCSDFDSTFVTVNFLPNANAGADLSLCFGNDTTLTASGGTNYLWSTTATSSSINVTPLADSTFFVTVSDVNGCYDIDSVMITVNSLPTADAGADTSVCYGESIIISASGGINYSWSNSEITPFIVVSPVIQTTYFVTVTDLNGCKDVDDIIVSVDTLPTPIIIGSLSYCTGSNATLTTYSYSSYSWSTTATSQTITATEDMNPIILTVTDSNGCTGISPSVNLIAGDSLNPIIIGNLNYCTGNTTLLSVGVFTNYQWSTGDTTQTINATIADNPISITVSDAGGCLGISEQVNVVENANPNPIITGNLSYCSGSSTILDAGVYGSYLWSNEATTQTVNVTSGTYTVSVTNGTSCSALALPVNVVENPNPSPVISGNTIYCSGDSTLLDVGSYSSYLWSNNDTTQTIYATDAINPITVVVTNSFGCTGIAPLVMLTESTTLTPTISGSLTYCTGNNAVLNTGLYSSYNWSTGANSQSVTVTETDNPISVTVTNADDCEAYSMIVNVTESSSLSPSISGNLTYCEGTNTTLDAGLFTSYLWSNSSTSQSIIATVTDNPISVTVFDSFGCSGTASVSVTENPNPTPVISGILDFCAGDSTLLTTSVYASYLWSNGSAANSIYAHVTDNPIVLIVSNTFGCIATDTVNVIAHSLPTAYAGLDNTICYGDSTSLTGIGGISFEWSTSETISTIIVKPISTTIYYLTVTDIYGCKDNDEVVVNVNPQINTSIVSIEIDCNGNSSGGANLTVTGGISPYSYSWIGPSSFTASTENISSLSAGSYYVTIIDSESCQISSSITLIEPAILTVSFSNNNSAICGNSNGSVKVNVTGGNTPYSYLWDSSAGNQTNQTATNLSGGDYQVSVFDANGCSAVNLVNIASALGGIASISSFTNNNCFGDNSGTATAIVTGGTSPFIYNWSNTGTTATITNLAADIYTVTIIDANSCSSSASVTITEPASDLQFNVTTVEADCYNGDNGEATVNVVSGTSPYTYIWSADNQTSQTATGLIPDNYYTVTVTDFNGCFSVDIVNIGSPSQIARVDSLTTINKTSCMGSLDGSIFIKYTGGTSPYSYYWNNGKTDDKIYDLSMGTYFITITDFNNCELVDTFEVGTNPTNCLDIPTAFTPNADSYNDTWEIKYLYLYPNASIKVFNRWGQLVYDCKDGCEPWDGTHNSKPLAFSPFTYIIDLNDGTDPINGVVTLIK